jgi:hypothetical protein
MTSHERHRCACTVAPPCNLKWQAHITSSVADVTLNLTCKSRTKRDGVRIRTQQQEETRMGRMESERNNKRHKGKGSEGIRTQQQKESRGLCRKGQGAVQTKGEGQPHKGWSPHICRREPRRGVVGRRPVFSCSTLDHHKRKMPPNVLVFGLGA